MEEYNSDKHEGYIKLIGAMIKSIVDDATGYPKRGNTAHDYELAEKIVFEGTELETFLYKTGLDTKYARSIRHMAYEQLADNVEGRNRRFARTSFL